MTLLICLAQSTGCVDDGGAGPTQIAGVQAPIIDGYATSGRQFPSVGASLRVGNLHFEGFEPVENVVLSMCTATLISPTAMLTAAHCVDTESFLDAFAEQTASSPIPVRVENVRLVVSFDNAPAPDFPAQQTLDVAAADLFAVRDSAMHPQYDPDTAVGRTHDVGILRLQTPVTDRPLAELASRATTEFALASAQDNDTGEVNEVTLHVVGYGQSSNSNLESGGVKRWGLNLLARAASSREFFTAPDEAATYAACRGDSGGPAFYEYGELSSGGTVLGVASRTLVDGVACSGTSIWARVDAVHDWIEGEVPDLPGDDGDNGGGGGDNGGGGGAGGGCDGCSESGGGLLFGLALLGSGRRRRRTSRAERKSKLPTDDS